LNSDVRVEDRIPDGQANVSGLASIIAFEGTIGAALADTSQRGGNETILLVEDEALVRKATGEVLQLAGYRVVIAKSAAQALEAQRESSEPLDLLLADAVLPGISGHELAQKFFVLWPHVRIMLMSGRMEQLGGVQRSQSPWMSPGRPSSLHRRNVLPSTPTDVILPMEQTSLVFLSHGELCWQRSSGRCRRRHIDESETPPRTAPRGAAYAFRHSSIHRGIRLARPGWDPFAYGGAQHGRGVHALCPGIAPFPVTAQRAAFRA
jgi:CheY-like chemotaxis protein